MDFLEEIQKQTERLIAELKWDDDQVNAFISQANRAISKTQNASNDETDSSLVTHSADYSGAFILFGGWTEICDHTVPSGTRGHKLYLAFGGLGVGGWDGDCDIEVDTEGSFEHDGKSYYTPTKHYGNNDWDGYNTAFTWFYDHVKSFMFMYLPVFMQPIPVFVYFDSSSNEIGISVPSCSISIGVGGGSVEVKS